MGKHRFGSEMRRSWMCGGRGAEGMDDIWHIEENWSGCTAVQPLEAQTQMANEVDAPTYKSSRFTAVQLLWSKEM